MSSITGKKLKTSLIIAFAIMGFFIFLFLYLKSVVFGLILAALFLPVQQWFYNCFLNLYFIRKINRLRVKFWRVITLQRFINKDKKYPIEYDSRQEQACVLTTVLFISLVLVALFLIIILSVPYIQSAGGEISRVLDTEHQQDLIRRVDSYLQGQTYYHTLQHYIVQLYSYFQEQLPLWGKSFVVVGVGSSLNFIFQAFLSLFFFIFFLQKISLFYQLNNFKKSIGDYVAESFFISSWTPIVNKDTQTNVKEIINTVIKKLITWVRGYSKIIVIEIAYYAICFYFIDIPYGFPLAIIAGMTILLPFLGPIVSIIFTLGVCFAVTGGLSSSTTCLVLGTYAIMNLLIEQFILYPKFVGGALGLSTLETIVVVLLGGIIGSIPGAILAVPIASILKYVIPKIYKSLK